MEAWLLTTPLDPLSFLLFDRHYSFRFIRKLLPGAREFLKVAVDYDKEGGCDL
jgi:hypothetical protein